MDTIRMSLATLLVAAMTSGASAAIQNGDVLVFDIGKTAAGGGAETAGNWNNMSAGGGGIGQTAVGAITDAVRLSDGAGTGVGLRLLAQESGKSGIGGADVGAPATTAGLAFTGSGAIPTTAIQDLGYISNEDLAGLSSDTNNGLLITGLDDSLKYTISWVSSVNAGRSTVTWVVGGTSIGIDPEDNTTVYSVSNVMSSGGEILIDVQISQANNDDTAHINALEIVATPEPASLALLGLGAVAVARRR